MTTRLDATIEIAKLESAMAHLERTLYTSQLAPVLLDPETEYLMESIDLMRQRLRYLLGSGSAPEKPTPRQLKVIEGGRE